MKAYVHLAHSLSIGPVYRQAILKKARMNNCCSIKLWNFAGNKMVKYENYSNKHIGC